MLPSTEQNLKKKKTKINLNEKKCNVLKLLQKLTKFNNGKTEFHGKFYD